MDEKLLLSHIINLRLENQRNSNIDCHHVIPKQVLSNNIDQMSEMVGVNSSEDLTRNPSKSEIYECAKLFVILSSCPSFYERLYKKAVYGPEFRIAMLALNIVKKSKGDLKLGALKIFAKISSMLGFKHISNKENESVSLTKNILFF